MAKRKYNTGTIRKRSKGSYEIGYRINGQRVTETIKTDDQQVAEIELQERLAKIYKGEAISRLGTRFSDVADRWLKVKRSKIGPKTYELWESSVRAHLKPAFGSDYLHQIDAAAIEDYVEAKLEGNRIEVKGQASEGPLSAKTVTHHLSCLSAIFSYAIKHKLAISNPVSEIERPALDKTQLPEADDDEIKALIGEMPTDADKLMVLLAVSLGLRIGEVLGLRKMDWNATKSELHIAGAVKLNRGQPYRDNSGKTSAANRILKVSDDLAKLITKQAKTVSDNKGLLFPSQAGTPLSPNNWRRRTFRPARDRAGLDIRFHDLRHIWATNQLAAGVSTYIVMAQGGWENIESMSIYAHLMRPSREQFADSAKNYL